MAETWLTSDQGREPFLPRPRLKDCVETWPECYEGGYDPRCCRFPKSCSADVYPDDVDPTLLESR